jgi:hypothetical protein
MEFVAHLLNLALQLIVGLRLEGFELSLEMAMEIAELFLKGIPDTRARREVAVDPAEDAAHLGQPGFELRLAASLRCDGREMIRQILDFLVVLHEENVVLFETLVNGHEKRMERTLLRREFQRGSGHDDNGSRDRWQFKKVDITLKC